MEDMHMTDFTISPKAENVWLESWLDLSPEEQQEICNALNRRTEFRVLRTTYGLFDTPETPKNNTEAKEQ